MRPSRLQTIPKNILSHDRGPMPMKSLLLLPTLLAALWLTAPFHSALSAEDGPVRVLFLGHEATHHPSNDYYPMLAKALGREAIYFDYVVPLLRRHWEMRITSIDLMRFFYANHGEITPTQWANLLQFVEKGHGFLPIHCASWCFANEPGFDQLVGGRFAHHRTGVFTPLTVRPEHVAIKDTRSGGMG